MRPLVTNRRVLTWLCVCSADEYTTIKPKMLYVSITIIVFVAILSAFAGTLAFVLKFFSVDLEASLLGFLPNVAYASGVYGMIVSFIIRKKINAIFDELMLIYNKSKS